MTGHGKKYTSKLSVQRCGEAPGRSEHPGVSSQHASKRRGILDRVAQRDVVQHVHQAAGAKRGAGDHPTPSSAKRAHAITLSVQPDFEIGTVPVLVPEGAMEVELDVGGFGAERRKESQFDVGGACRRNQHGSMFRHHW